MNPCEATKIHGPHGVHGFYLKILLKIFVKMSSIPDAIPQNSSPEATYCCVFSVEIFVKDYIFSHPDVIPPYNIRLNSV